MNQPDFRAELERLHAASFGWALSCCDYRRDQAEEVLQIAYLRVLENKARFDGNSSLQTWFFGVIKRTALEQRRRRWLREKILEGRFKHEPPTNQGQDPEACLSGSESVRALRKALAQISARQREVLHLVFYQDLTVEEASYIMRVSLGTARTHFARGKAQLREILAQQQGKHAKE